MDIRLYNARILPMAENEDVSEGEVWIDGSRIAFVGDHDAVLGYRGTHGGLLPSFTEEIDCKGGLLMPGFKDAHTHSAMTFLRSRADDQPLDLWLNTQVFPFEAKLTPDDIHSFTQLAILEYLTGGITGIMEMYLTPESIAQACNEMGMRCVQVGGVNNFSQSPELLEKWYNELNGVSELTSFCLGFHAEYTCSEELLKKIAALAEKYKAPVFTHCEETAQETQGCIERYGKTPIALFHDLGIFAYGGAGYHLVYTTDEDRRLMKQDHVSVVTNPSSNTKLASGIAPLYRYLQDGINMAIGTDGPASNNCLDMFREMFLATGLQKLLTKDASAMPAGEVLRMAVSTGARVMQIPDADMIAAGKLADLVLLDMDQPNMQPVSSIAANIVYAGSKSDVKMTMIGGKILYERFDGREHFHCGIEPADIYADVASRCGRIFA